MNKKQIEDLVSKMTLEEKAGLCSGLDFWHTKGVERLGVPSVMVSDGPHGLRKQSGEADHLGVHDSIKAVCFPAACATAASFDSALTRTLGETLGDECRAEDVAILLGPAINIKRSPLCGRNFEYFSEDPYLTGELAAAFVEGVESKGTGVSVKHFAANNQECRRMTVSAEADERTLREIYLAAFERVVEKASPATLMCSYNRINGVYASENPWLLTDVLRKDWGFTGFVMSDWFAVNDRVKGLKAGLDLEMPGCGGATDAEIAAAVRAGTLEEAVLDRAVENILGFVMNAPTAAGVFDREKDHRTAIEIERESAVLLKNDGVLPLSKGQNVLFIGEFAERPRYQGGGSSHINAFRVDGALEAAKAYDVEYVRGFGADDESPDEAAILEAVAAAKACDAAVIFAGLPDRYESEGYDRAHLRLPEAQNALIGRVAAAVKTVVVLHNGAPVEMPWKDQVAGILEMYLGGEGVGTAAAQLLFGEADPCGRLPETFPLRLEDDPSYLNFPGDAEKVEYREGVFVGYRYYQSVGREVLFPFGYGLSYTRFTYADLRLSADKISDQETLTVSVDVTNAGERAGKEAVQVYVSDTTGAAVRPKRELKAFAKVYLAPGETKTVRMTLDKRAFAWYHTGMRDFYCASGIYRIAVGANARDMLLETQVEVVSTGVPPFRVDGNTTVEQLYAHPKTRALAERVFGGMLGKGDGEKMGMNDQMMRAAYRQSPLRAARLALKLDREKYAALLQKFNECL